jgi:peptidyl-prolyl cis-trans isomerase-like 1
MYKFLIPLFALALLIGCTPKNNNTGSDSASSVPSPAMQEDTTHEASNASVSPSGFNGEALKGMHTVVLKTSMGDITVELDADKAPKAVTNFVSLSQIGYYNGLTFHRVIPGFMVQGGDPEGSGNGGGSIYGESFEDESNDLTMEKGVIAMANRGPNTNGSQFFITVAATPWLQGRHTIFGKVTSGMDVVEAMSNAARDTNDKPLSPITFTPEIR